MVRCWHVVAVPSHAQLDFGKQPIDLKALRRWASMGVRLSVRSAVAAASDVALCDRLSVMLHVRPPSSLHLMSDVGE